jgi:MFS family permease
MTGAMDDAEFFAWGWRVPFLGSAVMVVLGLWIRLKLVETPEFQRAIEREERVRLPMLVVLTKHPRALFLGTVASLSTFVVFYLMAVFALNWGTTKLGYTREQFLWIQMLGVVCFAAFIPLTALIAQWRDARAAMLLATVLIFVFGLAFAPLFTAGSLAGTTLFMALGMSLAGLTYGPVGTLLAQLFPTAVRYTGSSLAFNLSAIFGASLAPYVAMWLAGHYGLAAVGYYLSAAAAVTLLALLAVPGSDQGL